MIRSIQTDWKNNRLFQDLSAPQLQHIEPFVHRQSYASNEVIFNVGDACDYMFLIDDGNVEVFNNELKLAENGPGDVVGFMSVVDDSNRSATVVAGLQGAHGFIIKKQCFSGIMAKEDDSIVSTMLLNYLKIQRKMIQGTNDLSLEEARYKYEAEHKRVLSGQFFVQMVLGLVVLIFLLPYLNEKAQLMDSTYVNFAVIFLYGASAYYYMRKSGLPLELFGVTTNNFKPALSYMLKWTGVFVLGMFALKAIMSFGFPDKYGSKIIDFTYFRENGIGFSMLIAFLYSTHSIVQEFISRGCVQSGLDHFLDYSESGWTANIITTLMFSAFHLIIDMKFALATIVPSLFWGYLFHQKRNIWAVSISHIIIGLIAFFLLNIQ